MRHPASTNSRDVHMVGRRYLTASSASRARWVMSIPLPMSRAAFACSRVIAAKALSSSLGFRASRTKTLHTLCFSGNLGHSLRGSPAWQGRIPEDCQAGEVGNCFLEDLGAFAG